MKKLLTVIMVIALLAFSAGCDNDEITSGDNEIDVSGNGFFGGPADTADGTEDTEYLTEDTTDTTAAQ